jgi:ankyrin repeat protein
MIFVLSISIYVNIYQNKFTPLHFAAYGGHGKIVETLVEAKADLCAENEVSVLKETRLDADRGMR